MDFVCKSSSLSSNGLPNITIENTMRDPINITALGCSNKALSNMQSIGPVYLPSGASYTFTTYCSAAQGMRAGSVYTSYISINYTDEASLISEGTFGKIIAKVAIKNSYLALFQRIHLDLISLCLQILFLKK